MMNNSDFDLIKAIDRVRNVIITYTVPLAFLAILFDLISLNENRMVNIINLINLIQLIVSFLLYLFKKIDIRINFSFVIYFLISNIIFTNFHNIKDAQAIDYFLRDSLSIFILMPLAGMVISKFHILIIAFIYVLYYVVLLFITRSGFLVDNTIWTFVVFGGYSVCIFLFVHFMEKSILKQERLTSRILIQNKELISQKDNLVEINNLLNKQTSEIKRQQKELQKLNSTKDKFFSLIAHDLKAPMNSIIGLLTIFETKFDSFSEDKKKKYINLIKSASINTYALLENLLEWSISQTKTIKCNPKNINISTLFNQITELLGPAARNKKINITSSGDINCEVLADEHMVVTVLRNLVSNGIKYTPENGLVKIIAELNNNSVKVSVIDSGVGMPQSTIDSLFKIEKTSSTKGTSGELGTGLGLIISNEFLLKHGSSLEVTSQIDKGTTFSFSLPLSNQ